MRNDVFIHRPSTVRTLGCVALVLFCLNFLTFIDRNFGQEHDAFFARPCVTDVHGQSSLSTRDYPANIREVFRIEITPGERPRVTRTPISEELRLRAAQPSEADDALRRKLGLAGQETVHIPVMQ
jgi:hypothetical protein